MSYPKWLYHPTQEARIVPDEAAHKALGDEWKESPAELEPESAKSFDDMNREANNAILDKLKQAAKPKKAK